MSQFFGQADINLTNYWPADWLAAVQSVGACDLAENTRNCHLRLFKYLPEQYASSVLDGNLLFRNLPYFMKIEGDPRVDAYEGMHVDAPNNDVTITNVTTGQKIVGRFAYHNELNRPELIFCFCLSMAYDAGLRKFGGACIEITDEQALHDRIAGALLRRSRLTRLDRPLLRADRITYYRTDAAVAEGVDIKNPTHLPFLKRDTYAAEQEYRYVFAKRGGYELNQVIVNRLHQRNADIAKLKADEITLRIGSIRDIAEARAV
ncbi:hypothetical protein [Mesorhizobium sp. L-2-11]|uniref:hypothetical protein n=1 Tax=Mesorhizobium sp. L-2-11 TaxID=2744521 RepID=UPI0019270B9A|nr:hypothetical protein [Mesorhizobium sp. L-2-11]BCH19254.1 hypothetical protein MesoLjLa_61050 [Mesorhizobium sp. L-2-11]